MRLFPVDAPDELARREATVQRVLVDQGYPAPGIVFFADERCLDGRRFFVMERLPGAPLLGGIRVGELLRSGRRLFRRMVDVTVDAQARLHRLDAAPLVQRARGHARGSASAGSRCSSISSPSSTVSPVRARGSSSINRRPRPTAAICHGDLWAGNILVDGDRLTGVIDYTVATVAEPALDVGFTSMSLSLAPIDAPAPVQRLAAPSSPAALCKRYVAGYARDNRCRPLQPALLRGTALRDRVDERRRLPPRARPTVRSTARPARRGTRSRDGMIAFFRERTGVTIDLPPPV